MVPRSRRWVLLLGILSAGTHAAGAAELRVDVIGVEGGQDAPLADAVASLHAPEAPHATPHATPRATADATAEIDQRSATFVPAVLSIQAGTLVRFPNSDNTLHHVYSFSPAKRFELPLYSGKKADPVLFDKAGVVTLGCNIHDWMVAHVIVVDSPWHGRSGDDGRVRLQAPPGEYVLRIWHERAAEPSEQRITLESGGLQRVVRMPLAPAYPMPAADEGSDRLRALQQRLRERVE